MYIQTPRTREGPRRTLKLGNSLVFGKYFQGPVIQYCRTQFFPPSLINFQIASVHLPMTHTGRLIVILYVLLKNAVKAQKYAKVVNMSSKCRTFRMQNVLKCKKSKEYFLAANSLIFAH